MDDKPICVTMLLFFLGYDHWESEGESMCDQGINERSEKMRKRKICSLQIKLFDCYFYVGPKGLGTNEPEPFPRATHIQTHEREHKHTDSNAIFTFLGITH